MKPKFLNFALCDNDFGIELEQAARIITSTFGPDAAFFGEARLKASAVDLVFALVHLRRAHIGFEPPPETTRKYLGEKLQVTFSRPDPGTDHDGGSVCVDRATNYVWRY